VGTREFGQAVSAALDDDRSQRWPCSMPTPARWSGDPGQAAGRGGQWTGPARSL